MDFDSVQIGVADLAATVHDYEVLLGAAAERSAVPARFQLGRGAVELESGTPGVHSVRFTAATVEEGSTGGVVLEHAHGLRVHIGVTVVRGAPSAGAIDAVEGIDHVVIHSPDLERAIAWWRDRYGMRLALDRQFPARGLRMLFFRSAGVTLEFVSPLSPPAEPRGPDRFWGLAYAVADLGACRSRLIRAGVDVSEVRDGQKRGTIVATVRSGTAGVPTLLVQQAADR